jgi:hypothetical protein
MEIKRYVPVLRDWLLTVLGVVICALLVVIAIKLGTTEAGQERIDASREAAFVQSCEEQNDRHRRTVKELDRIVAKAERSVPRRQRQAVRASRGPTVLLIDELAPLRSCRAIAKESVEPKGTR